MRYIWLRAALGAALALSAPWVFELFRRYGSVQTSESPLLTVILAYSLPLVPLLVAFIVTAPLTGATGMVRWCARIILFFCGAAAGIFLFSGLAAMLVLSR